jgi:signal transduction histidine kinase
MARLRVVRISLWVAGLALGPATLTVALGGSSQAFAGTPSRTAVEIAGGWSLIAAGLHSRIRHPDNRGGILFAAAGAGSFLVEWANPHIGWAPAFTAGLVLYAAGPPFVAHAVLAYPAGRLSSAAERAALTVGYGNALVVLGLLSTVVFDPGRNGCAQCPANLLLAAGRPDALDLLNRIGITVGCAWPLVVISLLGWRIIRSSPALRRMRAPVLTVGAGYCGLVAADFWHSLPRHTLSNDPLDRTLWLAQTIVLIVLAFAVTVPWIRERRARQAMARLVVEMAASPPPGGLRDALARLLGEPSLTVTYPLADGRLVDVHGQPGNLATTVTPLVRRGQTIAVLGHRAGLLDDPAFCSGIAATSRLVLTNERLQAELATRLLDVRTSRNQIVTVGDAERRRLERDLHDGAQQRLLTIALSLRFARHHATDTSAIDQAESEILAAIEALRVLARGIFPAVLTDEGLTAAVEALMEDAPAPTEITCLPAGRFDPAVESTAYFVIAEAVRHDATTVGAEVTENRLVIDVDGTDALDVHRLRDRAGALDGQLALLPSPPGRVRIRVEIPCAS